MAVLYGVYDDNSELLGGAFFLSDLNSHILLFNISNKNNRMNVMAYLIDFYIKKHSCKKEVLDFEGSNISGVKRFYQGFGAIENNYAYIQMSIKNQIIKKKT